MAWDPNQGQQGQGQPGNGGQEPYSGYGAPQNPYGTPPPQDPYGTPPPQNPYGTPPPQYGFPPNQQGGYGYGYAPPQQPPRSLSQAIQALPNTTATLKSGRMLLRGEAHDHRSTNRNPD